MRSWGDWRWYEPTRPRPVKGGIKARSQRGRIGETWWSGKWTAFLESLGMGARLGRGKAYARRGQVVSMDIQPGQVSARVQGSFPLPYDVTIRLTPLSERQWEQVTDAMASQALFAARLLAGEMPRDIEEAFRSAGLSLFPTREEDLQSDCSCPDWANPCKHIAAVYYLLAEEFDRDPFMIFRLRGKDKDELIAALQERRAGGTVKEAAAGTIHATRPGAEVDVPPLEACMNRFWALGPEMASFQVTIAPPAVPLSVLKRLGPPAFWTGKGDIVEALGKVYGAVATEALRLAYGGEGSDGSQ